MMKINHGEKLMRWVRYRHDGKVQLGFMERSIITPTDSTWDEFLAGSRLHGMGNAIGVKEVELLAPIIRPGKIVAIGLNYLDHCRETNIEPPEKPLIFTKFTTSINDPGGVIEWSDSLTQQVDYEAELAVVIGRTARHVSIDEALDYVFGYTCANDVSARDLQFSDGQWVRGKSLDTFCPLGPWIVSADEIPDPQNLKIQCEVNGELLQDSHTSEMIFGVAELIAYCSDAFTLEPGDIILTGTPHGTGAFRDPKVFLRDGDTVAVEIENIGRIENSCRVYDYE
jgi:2-keto-4-pentenoate hydratase/2-oxohepta-3-ene-1,7-dioic acid hydratase in catechol pathway